MSTPAPVSASPPSRRSPTSRLGWSDNPRSKREPREASRPVRKRVTVAEIAARRPSGPSTPSIPVPTHSASALNASPNPATTESANSPRMPPAARAIDSPLLSAAPTPGVNVRAPLPYPVTPHKVIRSPAAPSEPC